MIIRLMKQSAWVLLLVAAVFASTLFVMAEAKAQQGADEAITAIPQSAQQNTKNQETSQSATLTASQPTSEAAASRVVVNPGDSLWSIAQENLGPNASPQQIEDEVGWIYDLNRDRIGDDPNLILAGQELFLPPLSGLESEVNGPTEPSSVETGLSTATSVVPEEPVVVSEQPSVPATAPGGTAEATSQPSDESVPQTATSEQPAAQSDANQPAQTPTESSTQPDNTDQRTIGLGILALSLLLLLALVLHGVRSLHKERERHYKALHYYGTPHWGQGEQEASLTGAEASESTPSSGGTAESAAEIPPEVPTTPSGDARILRLRARRLRAQRKLPKLPTTPSGDARPWRLRELRLRTQRKRVRSGYEERFPRGRW